MRARTLQLASRRGGFTFIELSISMVVITMIVGAMVGITWAVATGWHATDDLQSIQTTTRQVSTRLYNQFRSAEIIGLASADGVYVQEDGKIASKPVGGSCMFWRDDRNDDGTIQWRELTLIQRDPATNTLLSYSMPSSAPKAFYSAALGDMQSSKDADDFKSLDGVTSQVIATDVTAASFKTYCVGSFPQPKMVEFFVTFNRNGQVRSEYGTADLRAPLAGAN